MQHQAHSKVVKTFDMKIGKVEMVTDRKKRFAEWSAKVTDSPMWSGEYIGVWQFVITCRDAMHRVYLRITKRHASRFTDAWRLIHLQKYYGNGDAMHRVSTGIKPGPQSPALPATSAGRVGG